MAGFRSSATATAGNGAQQVVISKPTGTAQGDVMVAQVIAVDTFSPLITPPSGWTLADRLTQNSYSRQEVYIKTATASEPSSYTFGLRGTVNYSGAAATILSYSGLSAASEVDASSSATSTSGVAPSVTAPAGSDIVLSLFGITRGTTVSTASGTTSRAAVQNDSVSTCSLRAVDASQGGGSTPARSVTFGTSGDWIATTVAIKLSNQAPNAPTLTSPATNSTIDRGITQRFAWNFSDPDAGDSQSKFDLQYRLTGGTWTTVTGTTPNTYWDAAAGTFAAGNYEWQVRTYDAQGVVGPWSSSSFFTAATAPSPATITAPTSGGTVANTATLTWSAPNQTDYQWRRVKDNAGSADTSTIYYDSGDVVSATTRSVMVTFDTNNRWEHLQVRIKDNGLWSAWSDVRVQVSYTPPPSPTFTLAPDNTAGSPTQGSILVAITNPAPGAGQPAVSYNDVYVTDPGKSEERRATNVAANGTWRYWTPPDGFDGTTVGLVRVTAVATNGTTAST